MQRVGAAIFHIRPRLLGAIFHRELRVFSPSGKVYTTRGIKSIVFCHTFLRRVETVVFHVMPQALGANFHRKLASLLLERTSYAAAPSLSTWFQNRTKRKSTSRAESSMKASSSVMSDEQAAASRRGQVQSRHNEGESGRGARKGECRSHPLNRAERHGEGNGSRQR